MYSLPRQQDMREKVMVRRQTSNPEIWWLAMGSHSRSRQPSFAPATARPVVDTTYYKFGWNREKACFTTLKQHGLFASPMFQDYACDRTVALVLLWYCARTYIKKRFFDTYYVQEHDAELFVAAGHMCGVTRMKCRDMYKSRAGLSFYSPDGVVQTISLHDGMTQHFGRTMVGMSAVQIRKNMH